MPKYYPILLSVRGRKCVVVGGGEVAHRKVSALRTAGARVTVVSPRFCRRLAAEKGVRLVRRRYSADVLEGALLVVAATDSPRTNRQVAGDAEARRVLVNVVDVPRLCSFIVPATVSRGSLCLAISTGGASPALAKRIREDLEHLYGREYGAFLKLLERARRAVLGKVGDARRRRAVLQRLAGRDVLDALRREGMRGARARVREILAEHVK